MQRSTGVLILRSICDVMHNNSVALVLAVLLVIAVMVKVVTARF